MAEAKEKQKSKIETIEMKTIEQDIITPLLKWYDQNKRILPWRGSRDPYKIWVSEIMLQQTRVEAVKPYYERFMAELPDVHKLASAKEERLLKLWEGLGYYNRVRNMQKAAIRIEEQYQGEFPKTYDEIIQLSGIGSYTAGAIASIAFHEPVPAVDGNVIRIISRLILYEGESLGQTAKNEVRDMLFPFMDVQGRSGDINQALMELGATICVPNGAPHCEDCPWEKMCQAHQKKVWQEYPKKAARKSRRIEKKTVLIIGDGEHILLHKRPAKGLLAAMYELPNYEGELSEKEAVSVVRALGMAPLRIQKTRKAKHIFSHIEWEMSGYRLLVEPVEYWKDNTEDDNNSRNGHYENGRNENNSRNGRNENNPNGQQQNSQNENDGPDGQNQNIGNENDRWSEDYFCVTKEKTEKDYAIPSAFSAFTEYFDMKPGIGKKIHK